MKRVGTIVALQRFPVKSMAPEPLARADLGWNGILGDRQYAVLKSENKTRFPWLTGRDVPQMLRYTPRFTAPDDLRKSPVQVTTPDGRVFDLHDDALRAELAQSAKEPVQIVQSGRGLFDTAPLSLITTTNAQRLAEAHGEPIDLRRFRINVLIKPDDEGLWERDWMVGTLSLGTESQIRLAETIERCAMITLDPDTAAKNVRVMRTVAQAFDNRVGTYAMIGRPGSIAVGDTVFFQSDAETAPLKEAS